MQLYQHWGGAVVVRSKLSVIGLALLLLFAVGGCARYLAPGGPAQFRAMGITQETQEELADPSIARRLNKKPLATFPATLAVVRVQESGYRSHYSGSYGSGSYSVVTVRDVESDDAINTLASLPLVRRVTPLNRLVLSESLHSDKQIREAAALTQADLVLLYTFDTRMGVESLVAPLGFFTLGLFPEREARVETTASAALLDTRSGYIYGLTEASSKTTQLANAWTDETAVDQSRRRVEQEAFDKLVTRVEHMWAGVLDEHKPPDVSADSTSDDAGTG